MKKLLLSSISLFLFSSTIMIFQISCQKGANATPSTTTQKNKIVYGYDKGLGSNPIEIWISNIDGTENKKIPISLPTNESLQGYVSILPDGNKIVFAVSSDITSEIFLYTASTNGENLTKIITGSGDGFYSINAY